MPFVIVSGACALYMVTTYHLVKRISTLYDDKITIGDANAGKNRLGSQSARDSSCRDGKTERDLFTIAGKAEINWRRRGRTQSQKQGEPWEIYRRFHAAMSDRSRLGDITLALVALATTIFMAGTITALLISEYAKIHQVNAAYQQNAESNRATSSKKIAEACEDRDGSAFDSCIVDHLEAYYRQQATNQDLQAQQDMAFWAACLFISSTILTAIGIYLLWQTLTASRETLVEARMATKAAVEAADAAREALGAERAWLTFHSVGIAHHQNVTIPSGTTHEKGMGVWIVWMNNGRSPSINTIVCSSIKIVDRTDKNVYNFSITGNSVAVHGVTMGPNVTVEAMQFFVVEEQWIGFFERKQSGRYFA